MSSKAPAPSTQQLIQAARQLWRRGWPGWPDDPQATIAHPIFGLCVRGQARNLSRASLRPCGRPAPRRAPVFDFKRAAANDRDD